MIAELLQRLKRAKGLTQAGLAEVMGVPLQRVKHLTAGNVKNLTREESEALIQKLGVSAKWLATGEPPMFSDLGKKMELVSDAAHAAESLGIDKERAFLVMDFVFNVRAGNAEDARNALDKLTRLTPDEAALLDNYRNSPDAGREAVRKTAFAFAQPEMKKGAA